MRKRDLGIVLLAAFALFFAVQNEGSFSFREAWYHPRDDDTPVKHEAERLPPPLVTDLNGDGRSEVIVATADAKLRILDPRLPRPDQGFVDARVLKEVSLLPDKVRVAAGRRPVAMAAGVVQRSYNGKRKQVLVVVTSGWAILCFDHNLNKIWERDVQDRFPHGAHHREVAISISNYTLKHGDTGMVIVGGSMEVQQVYIDPFDVEDHVEREVEIHRVGARADESVDETNGTAATNTRHFSYYAFAGLTGELRWSHSGEDFHRAPASLQDVVPQHFYKLDAASLNGKHTSERECRRYRESVLAVLPHRWDRREDTRLELAYFPPRVRRKHHKDQGGKKDTFHTQDKPPEKAVPGKDSSNKFAQALSKAAHLAGTAKGQRRGFWVSTMITNHTSSSLVPNVVVAHLKEGIEAVHLATGRTICKLYLTEGGLHADINGDGVLDHVQAVGSHGAERFVPTGMAEVLRPCWAVATSGVPVREQLFHGPICRHSALSNIFQKGGQFANSFGGRAFSRSVETGPVEVATPVLFPRRDGHRRRTHGDVIFLTSKGDVTSYSVPPDHGTHNHTEPLRPLWQVATEASWMNPSVPVGTVVDRIVPTLEALPLRTHGPPEVILAAGETEAVILSPSGNKLAVVNLPEAPAAPLLYADFSGDGLNDLILFGSDGIYGFVQTRQPGALLFSSLLAILIIVIVVIFITQHFNGARGKPRVVDRSFN